MRSHQDTTLDRQIVALQSLLPQLDAEWETLSRSIQADQQGLTILGQHWEELSMLLRAEPEPLTHSIAAVIGQMDTLERQMRQVGEEIARKQLLRRALEQRFDEVRLVLCTLQQQGV